MRRRPADGLRDRRRRRAPRGARARSGGPTRPRTRWPSRSPGALHGTIPVIAGAGLTTPIAYRWKTQINENAKVHAFVARAARARPQRDRRLGRRRGPRPLLAGLPRRLRHASAHEGAHRAHRRLIGDAAQDVIRVESRGRTTRRARALARAAGRPRVAVPGGPAGVDPGPVDVLERLKAELSAS